MPGNQVKNAAFLDGTADWAAVGGAALAVDEVTFGAPGRAAMVVTHTASAAGETYGVAQASGARINVAAGQLLRAHGMISALNAGVTLSVATYDGSGTLLDRTAIPVVRPAAAGAPKRGLPRFMFACFAEFAAPASGHAAVECIATSLVAGAVTVLLLKPRLGDQDGATYAMFDPGPSDNVDLNLPVWPPSLPPPMADGYAPAQTPLRKKFDADAGVPVVRRIASQSLTMLKARYQLTEDQADDLRVFAEDPDNEVFWMVRADTDEVCQASWAEGGEPTMVQDNGETRIWEVGLTLVVA